MRRLFSEYGLTILVAIVSMYVFNIFSSAIYSGDNTQMAAIIRNWVSNLV